MISDDVLEKLEYFKVIGFIENECVTEIGRNIISNLRPSNKILEIVHEHKLIDQAKTLLIENLFPPLNSIPNILSRIAQSKISGLVLGVEIIKEILNITIITRDIKIYLDQNNEKAPELSAYNNTLIPLKDVQDKINRIIDTEGNIKSSASPRLREIRNELNEKKIYLNKVIQRILVTLQKESILRDENITVKDGRVVVPVKAEHKRKIKGFIHSESATGQTVFIEPAEVLDINNDILSLNFEEGREIEKILKELTEFIGKNADIIILNANIISKIDSIFARARYSIKIDGSSVQFDSAKPLDILYARHPLLIKRLGKEKTTPLSLKLSDKNVIVITGPNAGGKSVVLKTTGLISAMAAAGMHIPVSPDSNMIIFDNILVDIGDQQSIEEDLSTFSSHLTNIKSIVEKASSKTLVLIDEIGTGTDPEEGSALALATLLNLQKKGARVLASTHLGKIKIMADELEGFQNASMQFNSSTLSPTYKLIQGMPGSSYAFVIAKRLGFSEKFLDLANQFVDPEKIKLEKLLTALEEKVQTYTEKSKHYEIELSRYKGLNNIYEAKTKDLEREKRQILKEASKQAKEYLEGINKKIELEIRKIQESNSDKQKIKDARKSIENFKQDQIQKIASYTTKDLKKEDFTFNKGDYVQLKDTETYGQIVDVNEDKFIADVMVGAIKMTMSLRKLVPSTKKETKNFSNNNNSIVISDSLYRLDLRGKRLNEIDTEIIKFLDEAYTNGMDRIEILHGKGTGALKQRVKDLIKEQYYVKNYYYADIEMGGDGITIVEFK